MTASRISRGWALATAGAVVLGVLSLLAHEHLSGAANLLGDSVAIWLVYAFVTGSHTRGAGEAAGAGGVSLLLTVSGYYGALLVIAGRSDFASTQTFWVAAALVGGPLYGLFGHLVHSSRPLVTGLAAAAAGAAFLAEAGAYHRLGAPTAAVAAEVVAGAALPFVLARTRAQRLAVLAWLPGLLACGALGWYITLALAARVL